MPSNDIGRLKHRRFACLIVGWLAVAGWSCGGVSEEARLQSQADLNLGRAMFADENNAEGAIPPLERSIRRDPENAEAHHMLGLVYGRLGHFSRAEAPLRRAVELFAIQSVENESLRSSLADARNSLGVVLMNLGRYEEALPILRLSTEEITYGSQHLALGNLGLAYMRRQRYPEAIEVLQRAVRRQPTFCVGNARLGEAYARSNDAPHALEALDRAIATTVAGCDQFQDAFLWRAKARIQLHQPDAAREDLQRCVTLGANTPEGQECASLGRSVAP
ncbi:MAG: tetratricopeptide repeat protein [Myxococcaceae bacterium]|nr:MAG: tetratricopeptide repeat protein [Myxococcaceae bacterium]